MRPRESLRDSSRGFLQNDKIYVTSHHKPAKVVFQVFKDNLDGGEVSAVGKSEAGSRDVISAGENGRRAGVDGGVSFATKTGKVGSRDFPMTDALMEEKVFAEENNSLPNENADR